MFFFIHGYEEEAAPAVENNPVEPKTFTQEEVNRINKGERERRQAVENELKSVKTLMEQLQQQHTMTEAQKSELASKLEEFEAAKMTEEQRREHELNKFKKTYEEKEKTLTEQLNNIKYERDSLIITRKIKDLSMSGDVKAADNTGNQVLAILRHNTSVNEQGEVIVKGFEYQEDGKMYKEDLSVEEVIQKMKASSDWSNLWIDPTTRGIQNPGQTKNLPGDHKFKNYDEYKKMRNEGKIPYLKQKG